MQKKVIFPLVALGAAAVLAATVGAAGPDQPQLSSVSSANSKSVGFAPASRLSGELQQIAVAQGAMKLENPQGIITHYGYENDTPSAGDPTVPQMVPVGASQTEAQKTEPDKNTYLVFKRGLKGADASLRLRHALPLQGHENAATVNGGEAGLHHEDQPRRRHGSSRDAARVARRHGRADRDDRRLDLGPVRASG